MNDPKDMEALAALEHESWSGWAKWELDQLEKETREAFGKRRRGERSNRDRAAKAAVDDFRALPSVQRWRRQIATPYADLSEKEQESDRKVVREKLDLYRGDTQLCRMSVVILVWSKAHTKLLTVTNRRWGGFSCPGGKVAPGEKLIDAARRELLEETGCEALKIEPFIGGLHYDEPQDGGPPWWAMSFIAEIGDQVPRSVENGGTIDWHTRKQLLEKSLYPAWYKLLFRYM